MEIDWAGISAATTLLGSAITIWTVISTRNDLMRQIRADQLEKRLEALIDDLTEFSMLNHQVLAAAKAAEVGLRPRFPNSRADDDLQRELTVLRDKVKLRLPPSDPDLSEVARRFTALEENHELGLWSDLQKDLIESARDAFASKQRGVGGR